jgi:hypothetical protein
MRFLKRMLEKIATGFYLNHIAYASAKQSSLTKALRFRESMA